MNIKDYYEYHPGIIDKYKTEWRDYEAMKKDPCAVLWYIIPWEARKESPRCEAWYAEDGRSYSYGKGIWVRTYKSLKIGAFPEIFLLWVMAEEIAKSKFQGCFINGYRDGSDHLGWHSDDGPDIDDKTSIAVFTFGAEREIWLRPKPTPGLESELTVDGQEIPTEKVRLENGSIFVMKPGCQQVLQHRIPKASFSPCGPRISFTFRGLNNYHE